MKTKNLVAKHCYQFNKPKVERDRTQYNRKSKHKQGQEQMDGLAEIGVFPSYFTGYFAYIKIEESSDDSSETGTVQTGNRGCELYVSCRDEAHGIEIKSLLQKRYNPPTPIG